MRPTLLQHSTFPPPCHSIVVSLLLSFLPHLIVREFLKNLLLFSGLSCHLFYVRAQSKKYGLLSLPLSVSLLLSRSGCAVCHGKSRFLFNLGRKLVPRSAIYLCHKIISNLQQRSNNDSNNNEGNSRNYHNFWLVKVCNNFSRFAPATTPPETKK